MKRYGNLFEQVVRFENLYSAATKACRGKKKKTSVAEFYFHLENELLQLRDELTEFRYHPKPYTLFEVYEPKVRTICSSNFRDRVVHHAICNYLEPILERRSIFDSYACRVGKGTHAAVKRCQQQARKFEYYLKCDIRKFFASIDHAVLKSLLRRILKDPKLLNLLQVIIDHAVPLYQEGKGLPIGNLTSQHFANFYLGELDYFVKDRLGMKGYVRYMDDFIIFGDDKQELRTLLKRIEEFLATTLKLSLKPSATHIAPMSEGVPFLGFRVFRNLIRLQRPHLVRMRKKIKNKERLFIQGRLGENELIRSVSSIVAHVSHVNSVCERRKQFESALKMA